MMVGCTNWMPPPRQFQLAGVPLVVVRPGRQGEKQVARLSDTAVPRARQNLLLLAELAAVSMCACKI